jgi:DNA-directed RNA polymerase subunit beta
MPQTSLPESFRLLTKQLQGLGLGITVETEDGQQDDINNYTSIISEKEADEVGLNENKQETITIVTDEDESELDQF